MMNTLINALDRNLKWCKDEYHPTAKRASFDQAFGMAQMACSFYPQESKKIEKLWEEVYKPQFEKLIYGV